jgi:hypothetical protein
MTTSQINSIVKLYNTEILALEVKMLIANAKLIEINSLAPSDANVMASTNCQRNIDALEFGIEDYRGLLEGLIK